jgi:Flp pilus assembly pilin Flp
MKKIILLFLFPFIGFCQTQIGSDINGQITNEQFGTSVSLSSNGNIIGIGGRYLLRVFQNISGTWTQVGATIEEGSQTSFGTSNSFSSDGTIIAIGAGKNNTNGTIASLVRIYQYSSGIWTQIGSDINGEASNNFIKSSVSISSDGSIVAIGNPISSGNGLNSGNVRVFQNISGIWTQIGTSINGENAGDNFGTTVSISSDGSLVVIGAPNNDGNGSNSGHVRIYRNTAGTWTQIGTDINGENALDASGTSVSLSSNGTIIAIGAPNNNENGPSTGQVRIFRNISDVWVQIGADIDGESGNSGKTVSLSSDGTIIAVGSPSVNSGQVRVYKNTLDNWIQVGTNINGQQFLEFSGTSISLSSDGLTLASGAIWNNVNGSASGKVRVYDLSTILSSDSFILENFTITPNPTSQLITINLNDSLEFQKVTIYNTLGQIIKTETTKNISVIDLSKGTYFIEVETNQGKATKSFIKE